MVLGNPSAGGPYPNALLPGFWRAIGPALPNGAGTTVVRNLMYFNSTGLATPLLAITAYAVAGAVLLIAMSGRRVPTAKISGVSVSAPTPEGADVTAEPATAVGVGVEP